MKNSVFRDCLNFRDLGGIKVKDGRSVRPGLLMRSGALIQFNETELETLRSFHIHTILDLRAHYTSRREPDPDIGARQARYDGKSSLGGDKIDFSPKGFGTTGIEAEKQLAKLTQYYANMPFQYDAFHVMMKELSADHKPFLFHCAQGKDRTGIAAMVILLALGADEETVIQDYLLSNEFRKKDIEARMEEGRRIHGDDEAYMTLMFLREGVREEIGRAPLAAIKDRFGSYEKYFESEYGLSEENLESMRGLYLE